MVSYRASATDLEPELSSGEHLLWSGKPATGLRLRPSDAFVIPFSVLWAGFAVFWEFGVISSGAPFFFMLWGIPFVLMGGYITVGRFVVDAYLRANTRYGLTNERIIISSGVMNRRVKSLPVHTLQDVTLDQHRDGSGTITFGPSTGVASWYGSVAWPGTAQRMPPAFELIPDAKSVYERVRDVQRANRVMCDLRAPHAPYAAPVAHGQ